MKNEALKNATHDLGFAVQDIRRALDLTDDVFLGELLLERLNELISVKHQIEKYDDMVNGESE